MPAYLMARSQISLKDGWLLWFWMKEVFGKKRIGIAIIQAKFT